jgi:hypothetical protein
MLSVLNIGLRIYVHDLYLEDHRFNRVSIARAFTCIEIPPCSQRYRSDRLHCKGRDRRLFECAPLTGLRTSVAKWYITG